ncbi:MAG: PLP-dependent aminotransferase family protein [Porticoccaceae bacterium]|nr:PLP-dependent aminotransferase family protein [Porticoccaceae bacterium]
MRNSQPKHLVQPSYIREILHAATSPEMISLAGGLPATSSFPTERMREAVSVILDDPTALQYSTTEGEPELRRWIAESLNSESLNTESSTPTHTDINQILITNGAQQAMDLVARTLLKAGDKVVVEAPAYPGALQVFNLARANIIPVDQESAGPNLKQLEAAFRQQPKLFYAMPDFHNPTGCCWSVSVRREVISLAKKYQVTIIEDAPYRALRYSGETLPSLYQLSPEGVFHIGSFSKVAAPGLRLGYLCADSKVGESAISDITVVKQTTDLHSSTFCQRLLLACLQEPFHTEHLLMVRQDYRHRRDTLAKALTDQLGDQVSFAMPEGGMFLWLGVNNIDSDLIAARALDNNIAIVPGSVFYPGHHSKKTNKIRLNFSHATPALLTEGIKRLAGVIKGF